MIVTHSKNCGQPWHFSYVNIFFSLSIPTNSSSSSSPPSCHVCPFLHSFSFFLFLPPLTLKLTLIWHDVLYLLMCCPRHVFYPVSVFVLVFLCPVLFCVLCLLVLYYLVANVYFRIFFLLFMGPRTRISFS